MSRADSLVVLDFETTGLSPDMGDRAIEIGAVKIEEGVIVDQFQALMNPGRRVDPFIERYTGITNTMLTSADSCADVMADFAEFIGDSNLLAHNASFDKRFLDAEFQRIKHQYRGEFICSLLVSRRIFQNAPNHKLGTLVGYCNIESNGAFHRALYDSEMTAKLWLAIIDIICQRSNLETLPFNAAQKLCKTPKKSIDKYLESLKPIVA
ncbi:3'-5' exonuclease [Reinekea marina]|uniref:DNA-directed DNA polymerase n=1 Tax=Reinekea marina TaxID=1310421 RepID=A0ABV7WTB7_9GAMM|nr:3'-5' exonuclease [Reinekea marina]MDN3649763.1 3'-5' exonuclease [Reinekea marina]